MIVAIRQKNSVIPAKAGIQRLCFSAAPERHWIPAFAGMTSKSDEVLA
jgi:hypothetical protein